MSIPAGNSVPQVTPTFEDSVVAEVSTLVTKITGVQLGERQRMMVETRLKRRIADLGLSDEHEYLRYLRAHPEQETEALVSLLTTHHTFFFREFQHFQFLEHGALAQLVAAVRARGESKLRVWSAACSRGQEVYSLAMFLAEHLPRIDPGMSFEILGTDVDRESVGIAQNGVFHVREIKQVPAVYLADHWARGTGDIVDFVKVKKTLRAHCNFKPVNLLDSAGLRACGKFDLIFCRNVFIYFTPEQIRKISTDLANCLHKTGLFIIGLSESLNGLTLPLDTAGPSVYIHAAEGRVGSRPTLVSAKPTTTTTTAAAAPSLAPKPSSITPPLSFAVSAATPTAPKRVLCVDDSPSVLAILKQILTEKAGYQIVGTAGSGIEAATKVRELKPDLVTLDIHMPEMTGLEYLKKHWSPSHPPVVMISSVAREDASLALECLKAGAADYVEKPALTNLTERGDEIRTKLSCALHRSKKGAAPSRLDHTLAGKIPEALRDGAIRVVVAGLGDQKALAELLKDLGPQRAPIAVLTEGVGSALPAMIADLQSRGGIKAVLAADQPINGPGVYVGELSRHVDRAKAGRFPEATSIMIFGEMSPGVQKVLSTWRAGQVLLEDVGRDKLSAVPAGVSDVCPATSFAYMAQLFLSRKA